LARRRLPFFERATARIERLAAQRLRLSYRRIDLTRCQIDPKSLFLDEIVLLGKGSWGFHGRSARLARRTQPEGRVQGAW